MSDDDKQTIFGFPVASIGFVDKEREAEIARLRAELDQARVQLAGCLCAAEGTGDADKVKQGDYAWTPALQKTVELRAALAEAERERDEARAALEILRNSTATMPAWVCPKCGRSHPMIESGCPCFYDNIKITTGTVSTPRRIEPRFDDERGQADKDASHD